MADTDVPPMHADFARWYREVGLDNEAPRRAARWEGLCSVLDSIDADKVEGLIRLVFRTRHQPAPATVLSIRQAFKDVDDTFDMQGNDRELHILAAACLAVVMEADEGEGPYVAVAVTTAALGGARTLDVPMPLVALAENAISRIAYVNRKRPTLSDWASGAAPTVSFAKATAKIKETQNFDGVAEAFALAAASAQTTIKAMAALQNDAVKSVEKFVRIQDEELQMLWWLIGQRSTDYDCPFESISPEAQPLIFANELAKSTEFLPGPPSLKALLSRAGLKERKKLTIPAAVNAANKEWLQQVLAEEEPCPVVTPIHFAIKRHLETGEDQAWVAGWAAATGISATHTLSPLLLGTLFYRERLLHLLG